MGELMPQGESVQQASAPPPRRGPEEPARRAAGAAFPYADPRCVHSGGVFCKNSPGRAKKARPGRAGAGLQPDQGIIVCCAGRPGPGQHRCACQ